MDLSPDVSLIKFELNWIELKEAVFSAHEHVERRIILFASKYGDYHCVHVFMYSCGDGDRKGGANL